MHPQTRKTPRSETTKHRRRSRGAGAPSSRRLYQSLLGRRRGGHCLRRRCRLRGAEAPSSRRLYQSLLGRRRGGTPPRSVNAKLRKRLYSCILRHERPRVARPRSTGGGRAERGLRPQGACINHCWGAAEGGTACGGGAGYAERRLRPQGACINRCWGAAEGALPRVA